MKREPPSDVLDLFHGPVRSWFEAVFREPTRPQRLGWPAIARGESTLILAPTGTGKTLAAFLWCINRLMFAPVPAKNNRCRVLYISPIKALAVDVERNLQSPLVGIAQAASRSGAEFHEPSVAIRTGDTPPAERARFLRRPSDILITTPESLYLLLTSSARDILRSVETVVIDEIHAVVPTKRGSHLALSLERLERLCERPLQRIGLSATQRPLDEVARFLGGVSVASGSKPQHSEESTPDDALGEFESTIDSPLYRKVTVLDASESKKLDLRVTVPVEDMSRLDELDYLPSGAASQGPVRPSIWSAIHPKLLELVREHQSTLIFVNSRRLAERISGAVNDLAGETLVRAHHGSVAADQRREMEDRLKLGTLRGIVATSSLELGIDMGAVDLVVQIESPPSVASGMQRVGRANHHVGGQSTAIIFPKYRGDLAACAAITRSMHEGKVESVHFPRNPLDVLAQQLVAMVAMEDWDAAALYDTVRCAAPFAALTRPVFDGLLDMLSGRFPSDDFVDLHPRLTWDRITNRLTIRKGARQVAITNGGTIPDRGLFGVFMAGASKGARVGELDEEMVFESRVGDTIILGASTWRIDQITHERVTVTPAPGEPGKMPFWHGDAAGRPVEFGRAIGRMTRELLELPRAAAYSKLVEEHSLDGSAAENLLAYLQEQAAATGQVPSDRDIVIERCRDELGDFRLCVLTPYGSRVHAPWCMAVTAKLRAEQGIDVETMWTDDGFVIRLPESDQPLDTSVLLPTAAELKDLVLRQVGSTSLFAAKFREAAGRALLLPKRRPGKRTALWMQRKRSADLLSAAARYSSFPILLETYRECVRDVFDLTGASDVLRQIQAGHIRVTSLDSLKPSPFASTLLFSYIANYIYDGDAPLAERRAQALAIDQSQLEEILGTTDFRELLDRVALDEVEAQLQSLDPDYQARHVDALHDLLLKLGDLSNAEIVPRCASPEVAATIGDLLRARRVIEVGISGETRYIPAEYASRYRDAIGVPLPPGLAGAFLERTANPLLDLVRRYARTHGPFTTADAANRYGLNPAKVESSLKRLHAESKLLEGEFRPDGIHREWCDPDVLQRVRRLSLARLRREVEPASQQAYARMLARWQGVTVPRRGMDALLDAVEILQGVALLASDLEREILPARVLDYQAGDIDAAISAGEVVWTGRGSIGDRDGRIALYLADSLGQLLPPIEAAPELSTRARLILEFLETRGASFFAPIHEAAGGGFPGETTSAIWELVWAGLITNDTLQPLRHLLDPRDDQRPRAAFRYEHAGSPAFLRQRRAGTGLGNAGHGRWSLIRQRIGALPAAAEWSAATSRQLLARYGIVMRETALADNIPGGYQSIYPALRTMEESGWVRRGMFVQGLGAAQFAMNSAVDMLRSLRVEPDRPETVFLAASDPANPYGTVLPWPDSGSHGLARSSGASVVLVNGRLAAYLRRRNPDIRAFLPDGEPELTRVAVELSRALAREARRRQSRKDGLLITNINGDPAREHFLSTHLEGAGFVNTASGYQMRRPSQRGMSAPESEPEEQDAVERG